MSTGQLNHVGIASLVYFSVCTLYSVYTVQCTHTVRNAVQVYVQSSKLGEGGETCVSCQIWKNVILFFFLSASIIIVVFVNDTLIARAVQVLFSELRTHATSPGIKLLPFNAMQVEFRGCQC